MVDKLGIIIAIVNLVRDSVTFCWVYNSFIISPLSLISGTLVKFSLVMDDFLLRFNLEVLPVFCEELCEVWLDF
jgi:hypothetical protein